jgi:hypothetical protein
LTQAQAVKQAWAIQYSKEGKSKKVGDYKLKGDTYKDKKGKTLSKKGKFKVTRYDDGKFAKFDKIGAASSKVKAKKGKSTEMHTDTKSHNVNIRVLSGLFDTSVIKDLDQLKKEYFKLAKTYHPDAGGTKEQFQALQNEYEKLLKNLINGSSLSSDQKKNEFEVDKAIRDIIDSIISLEGINIELVGKWLWISGNTYPVRNELKKAGLLYIKKDGFPYWVYKGSMSRGRGNLSIDEIKQKYGSRVIESRQVPKIGSIGQVKINKNKFGSAIQKLVRSLNKRPV